MKLMVNVSTQHKFGTSFYIHTCEVSSCGYFVMIDMMVKFGLINFKWQKVSRSKGLRLSILSYCTSRACNYSLTKIIFNSRIEPISLENQYLKEKGISAKEGTAHWTEGSQSVSRNLSTLRCTNGGGEKGRIRNRPITSQSCLGNTNFDYLFFGLPCWRISWLFFILLNLSLSRHCLCGCSSISSTKRIMMSNAPRRFWWRILTMKNTFRLQYLSIFSLAYLA